MLRQSAARRSSRVSAATSSAVITAATSSTQPSSRAKRMPLLAAEVVVDRAGGALGRLGDGVDGAGLDPAGGEQVSGRVEEALARLGSPLPLGGHHAET